MGITVFGVHRAQYFVPFAAILTLTLPASPLLSQKPETAQTPTHQSESTAVRPPSLPLTPLSQEELGDLQMARRHYQAAIQFYQQIPHATATACNKLGMAYQQLFMLQEAKKSYELSLKLNPNNPDVINNLGTVYYSLKDYGHAERLYRKALKIQPGAALIHKNMGTALLASGKFKKGWENYQTALAIDPEIFERDNQFRIGEPTPAQKRGAMNFFLAKSYVRVGMNDRAVGYLRMAIDEGFTDRKRIMNDREFASLRGLSAFEQLLAEQNVQ
jgi:tetratricopeptide (TPR) repeat protein